MNPKIGTAQSNGGAARIHLKVFLGKLTIALTSLLCAAALATAQELAPRAYVITPLQLNAITLTYSYYTGSLQFDGAVPITGATGKINIPDITYYHSLNFFGRSANIIASLPYGVGNLRGYVAGAEGHLYRSGLLDSFYRFSVNLKGGPAMPVDQYLKWHQKMLIGASIKIVTPTGQYDPTKLINWGNNRWAFKPEIGYSQRWGHWVVDAYGAAWFFTTDPEFYSHNELVPGTQTQSENPIAAFEGHLSYDIKPRLWVSLDANFWRGGETSLNGVPNSKTLQQNSRIGVTAAIPITKHQSLKVSYNDGAYINYGGNFQNISVAWQYSWIGWPK
ncbi:MAG: transporter [Candidatus Acidiferrum sp.]